MTLSSNWTLTYTQKTQHKTHQTTLLEMPLMITQRRSDFAAVK